jgi:DNA-binding Xre family transcriptional regulator
MEPKRSEMDDEVSRDARPCSTAARGIGPRRRGSITVKVDAGVFRRMLRERNMTGEDLRRSLRLSPSTLAKLYRGASVRDEVFKRVVHELERRPVKPIARELVAGPVPDSEAAAR